MIRHDYEGDYEDAPVRGPAYFKTILLSQHWEYTFRDERTGQHIMVRAKKQCIITYVGWCHKGTKPMNPDSNNWGYA